MKKKTLFKMALAIKSDREGERYTAHDFCEDYNTSTTVLYDVLNDRATSARVSGHIDAFIEEQFQSAKPDLPKAA